MMTLNFKRLLRSSAEQGWYLLRGDKTYGPVPVADLLKINDLDDTFVSRRGLSHWYPLSEFLTFFEKLDEIGPVAGSAAHLGIEKLETKQTVVSPRIGTSRNARPRVQSRVLGSLTSTDSAIFRDKIESNSEIPSPKPQEPKRRSYILRPEFERQRVLDDQILLLRLGQVRNCGFGSFLIFLLSMGVSWLNWFALVHREIEFHVKTPVPMRYYPYWIAALPMFHIWGTYELASLVVRMERQNGYQSIRPEIAAFLAIFPPLAMHYIQSALNRHWAAHLHAEWQKIQ